MKFTVKLPFSEVVFINAQERHKKYFESLFFAVNNTFSIPKYKIAVHFGKIKLSSDNLLYLEEDTTAEKGSIYISDTKKNKVKISPGLFTDDNLIIEADNDFDLYYLYNNIIEPLLIIWGARYGVLYVHSSSIWKDGKANVFPAWRHTGKTSSIFSLAKEKIKFMGDDFCVIYGSKAYLYPKYINIFSYNFESFPWLYRKLPFSLSLRIKVSVYLKKFLFFISQKMGGSLSKIFFRLSELAEVSTNTKIVPNQLDLPVQAVAPLGKVVFITKSTKSGNREKLTEASVQQKLLAITKYEISNFLAIYQKYRYLYPLHHHPILDSFEENFLGAVRMNLKEAYETRISSTTGKDAWL